MIVIGVDPHKRTHTATAVDASSNTTVATLQIDASLPDYRRLLRWARRFPQRRWAVENARGLGRHLAQWLTARGERVEDGPRRRPPGCVSSPAAAGARTTSSTPRPPPASPRCTATPTRCSAKTSPPCWRCSTSGAATSSPSAPGWSTSCTHGCVTSDWAALVTVLRRILAGERGEQLLAELDAVDTEIARETLHRLSDGQ